VTNIKTHKPIHALCFKLSIVLTIIILTMLAPTTVLAEDTVDSANAADTSAESSGETTVPEAPQAESISETSSCGSASQQNGDESNLSAGSPSQDQSTLPEESIETNDPEAPQAESSATEIAQNEPVPETTDDGSSLAPGDEPELSAETAPQDQSALPEEAILTDTPEPSLGEGDESGDLEVAAETGQEGNSYIAEVTSGRAVIASSANDFTVVFTELGDMTLGSAQIALDNSFTVDEGSITVSATDEKTWLYELTGSVINLWAEKASDYINKDQSLTVGFNALAPSTVGAYTVNTAAWTNAEGINPGDAESVGTGLGNIVNNPHSSHVNPTIEVYEAQSIGGLNIGDRLVDYSWVWEFRTGENYTSVEGDGTKPVVWVVVAKDHYGDNTGIVLMPEELIGSYVFDNSIDRTNSIIPGSSHWGDSGTTDATRGLRLWLNSTGVYEGNGFYQAFSDEFKMLVNETILPNKDRNDGANYTTVDKVFIPSSTELGDIEHRCSFEVGSTYAYFIPEDDAGRIAALGGADQRYWTRTPSSVFGGVLSYVNVDGSFTSLDGLCSFLGAQYSNAVRPVVVISNATNVSATKNSDGLFVILHSLPAPETPEPVDEFDPQLPYNYYSSTITLPQQTSDQTQILIARHMTILVDSVSSNFVTNGTQGQLQAARLAYNRALQLHQTHGASLNPAEKAAAETTLAVAWAAIQTLEVSLKARTGEQVDLGMLLEAYNQARAVLAASRELLSPELIAYANAILAEISTLISSLTSQTT
jgi:hypothetical protein